jgi:hypothetical protein
MAVEAHTQNNNIQRLTDKFVPFGNDNFKNIIRDLIKLQLGT